VVARKVIILTPSVADREEPLYFVRSTTLLRFAIAFP